MEDAVGCGQEEEVTQFPSSGEQEGPRQATISRWIRYLRQGLVYQ